MLKIFLIFRNRRHLKIFFKSALFKYVFQFTSISESYLFDQCKFNPRKDLVFYIRVTYQCYNNIENQLTKVKFNFCENAISKVCPRLTESISKTFYSFCKFHFSEELSCLEIVYQYSALDDRITLCLFYNESSLYR